MFPIQTKNRPQDGFCILIQNYFHLGLLYEHSHFVIEFAGVVALPDIQGHVIAADGLCELLHILEKYRSDMLTAAVLINAQIVDVQSLYRLHIGGKRRLPDHAERTLPPRRCRPQQRTPGFPRL